MSDSAEPTERNRLDEAESPYLRQHADNPVNWQPWDEQALEAAREREMPIFLSIGYAACHWCHVMEEESFEDEAVAELLNENFVPIKVDREERPDLDSVYMSICQQVTGGGGWPLSAWLTPEGKPFYVGTYFPPEEKQGRPGFSQLIERLADSWSDPEQRTEMENRAQQWTDAIESDLEDVGEPGDPDENIVGTAATIAHRGADRDHGGWGSGGPKFPQTGRIHALLRAHADGQSPSGAGLAGPQGDSQPDDDYLTVVEQTLNAMADRGLYDHVGGGFHRYSTDMQWAVPHFEKMLYDNAEIPRAFLAGYQAIGSERYASVVRETFEFVQRELQHEDGGFFSTLDAVSRPPGSDAEADTEEGAFYVWTPEQVHDAVSDEQAADIFCEYFGVSERGNFEGATVLGVRKPVDVLAEEYETSEAELTETLQTALTEAFQARADRPRPARDEKILAGWNGLMISALAEGAIVLDDAYADVAADALGFVREQLWDESEQRLSRRYKDGDVAIDGYLEDYAFLGRGAFDCYQATGEVDYLDFALDLAAAIVEAFWDETEETLYFTPTGGESLVARPQELTDQSTPSSTGVAVSLLLELAHFSGDDRFAEVAEQAIRSHADRTSANPLQHASLTLATDTYEQGSLELTLVCDPADPPAEWTETLADRYVPRRLLAPRPADDATFDSWLETLDLAEAPPIWAGRDAADGEPTVYACRNFACSPPRHDLGAALDWGEN
ncbi:thioredoxin domain-containing protein [Haloarcula onubensis]|uniref:Thioredoxin domain-containing protein n=1 Tax=Haloarcula onubensis TaxID=2950539 RepID=A0ABU2FL03_9EURY|nr:thioredoxin domain-containing protein [Halomicroarcula sp. S3CR25-11]MDS0281418.1 thioredoxin domain-containing protein [Halomicroarcula sp. S3CR25-11]